MYFSPNPQTPRPKKNTLPPNLKIRRYSSPFITLNRDPHNTRKDRPFEEMKMSQLTARKSRGPKQKIRRPPPRKLRQKSTRKKKTEKLCTHTHKHRHQVGRRRPADIDPPLLSFSIPRFPSQQVYMHTTTLPKSKTTRSYANPNNAIFLPTGLLLSPHSSLSLL